MKLYDAYGREVDLGRLKLEQAGATMTGVRNIYASTHPSAGLTPQRLGAILRQAEFGDPYLYLELAEEMEEKDLHYLSVLSTRKRAVSQLRLMVKPASDSAEDRYNAALVEEILLKGGFDLEGVLFDILDAVGKGFSVTEIIWDTAGRIWMPKRLQWRDPRWFMFDWISGEQVLVRTLRTDGQQPLERLRAAERPAARHSGSPSSPWNAVQPATAPLEPFKFIVHFAKAKSGLPVRGGLARAAGWAYLFKNYALKDWVAFAEVFGQPLRIGKYGPGATDGERQILLQAVANIGADAAAVIPESMAIEFVEAQRSGSTDLYERFCDFLDRQVSKAVLGQTLTTDIPRGAGSRAAAQVHNEVRSDIMRADRAQLEPTLNRDLVRPVIDLNLGPQRHYPRLAIVLPEDTDLDIFASAATLFIDRGLKVDQNFVRSRLGIPEPEPGAELLAPRSGGANAAASRTAD